MWLADKVCLLTLQLCLALAFGLLAGRLITVIKVGVSRQDDMDLLARLKDVCLAAGVKTRGRQREVVH